MSSIVLLISLFLTLISAGGLYKYIEFWQGKSEEDEENKRKKRIIVTVLYAVIAFGLFLYENLIDKTVPLKSFYDIVIFALIFAMAFVDFKDQIIPNHLIVAGLVVWLIKASMDIVFFDKTIVYELKFSAFGGLVCGGLLMLIGLMVKTAVGMGDAKMFFVLGLIYGLSKTYSLLLITLIVMALVSIVLLILKRANRKTTIPMAPFVTVAFAICVLIKI